jgi:hypothetical protein
VKRTVEKNEVETVRESESSQERKAPTSFARRRAGLMRKRRQQLIVAGFILVGVGASAAVGLTDKGEIDIDATIEARNERIRSNTASEEDMLKSNVELPVQNTTKHTSATLRGRGTGATTPKPKPPVVAGTSTASTTDATASSTAQTASSTEEVVEDVADENETDVSETVSDEEAALPEVAPLENATTSDAT